MHDDGQSDGAIVPKKPSNNGDPVSSAEEVEGRAPTKGNSVQQNRSRTQCREDLQHALDRVRQAAKKDRKQRFTALWHHVYDVDRLREAFLSLKRKSAPGVDRVTWHQYADGLEARLQDLSARLQRGAYRARPVLRKHIPKEEGRQRLIGIPALEDKVVQRATAEVLNAIYEVDFLGFSYGFRPGRRPHHALDALAVGIQRRKVNWVLDADIRGFFDAINHEWLMRFVEHRIADKRVLRHLKKWLKAGVMEDGKWSSSEEGTPQGGSISPLMANVYLHYAFDLWIHDWRQKHARGDIVVVRWADDFVVGFQHRMDAERFVIALRERFHRFNLELHPDKTRLIEFGRFAAKTRQARGDGKPETFDFLGFTHICGRTQRGWFTVRRKTMAKRFRRRLRALKVELWRRLHQPIPVVGRWLRSVVQGWFNYHAIPHNYDALSRFRYQVLKLWRQTLMRRSQKAKVGWQKMDYLANRYLPKPCIRHPYPSARFARLTRGRSPVR